MYIVYPMYISIYPIYPIYPVYRDNVCINMQLYFYTKVKYFNIQKLKYKNEI